MHYSCFFILFLPALLGAQHSFFLNYTDKEGLPTNELYSAIQTQDGAIWVGSDLGLLRFNGINYKLYNNSSVRNKSVTNLYEDEDGLLWCTNFSQQVLYFKDDSLQVLEAWDKIRAPHSALYEICKAPNPSEVVIQSSQGCYLVKKTQENKLQKFQEAIRYFYNTPTQTYTFNLEKGIQHISNNKKSPVSMLGAFYEDDKSGKGSQKFYNHARFNSIGNKNYFYFQEYLSNNNNNNYHNDLGQKLDSVSTVPYIYELTSEKISPLYFPEAISRYGKNLQIINIYIASDSSFYITGNKGLFHWKPGTNEVERYFHEHFISSVFIDTEGNIWATSLDQGLFCIPAHTLQMYNTRSAKRRITKFDQSSSGMILLGYIDGVVEGYDLPNDSSLFIKKISPSEIEEIKYAKHQSRFWVSSKKGFIVDSSGNVSLNPTNTSAIKELLFDDQENIIKVLGSGVIIQHREEQQPINGLYKEWHETYPGKDSVLETSLNTTLRINQTCCPRAYSGALRSSPDYHLWIGYADYLIKYSQQQADTIRFADGRNISAASLCFDAAGNLWAGSINQGLLQIVDGKIQHQLTIKNSPLPDNSITKVISDGLFIWAASSKGVAKIDTKTGKVLWVLNKYYGLPATKITDMEIWNKQLLIGAGDKLYSLMLNVEEPKSTAPPIYARQFWVNDTLFSKLQNAQLNWQQNAIKIELEGFAYRSQGDFHYKYRLKGLEKNWSTSSSSNNIIRYPSLPPGNYVFEAYCVNEKGIESTDPTQISFTIYPPFWQTWWFFTLSVIAMLGLGAILFWWQIQRIRRRDQEKLERSQLERDLRISQLTALKAQMNPHFIFNALNSIQGLYAINNKATAYKQLSKFAKLVRLTLDMSNELFIPLSKELELLKLYLQIEQIRFMDELQFEFHPPKDLNLETIKIPSLLIQPYVENAVKHGLLHKSGDKKVTLNVVFDKTQQILKVSIDDNGIGRDASAQINLERKGHQSFATSANRTRLQLLNADRESNIKIGVEFIDKKDELGQATGTTVIINIPINTD